MPANESINDASGSSATRAYSSPQSTVSLRWALTGPGCSMRRMAVCHCLELYGNASAGQLILHHALGNLPVARFRKCVPEIHLLGHFVAGDAGGHPVEKVLFAEQ